MKLSALPLLLSFTLAGQTVSSSVDARIAAAQKQIEAHPKSAGSYNDLAFAYIRKGRDYQDAALYRKAGAALDQALKLSPDNYDAQKLRVAVLLGLKQPVEALSLETKLNKKIPDDIAGWGLLVDANAALGNYEEAVRDAQWILDLRPGSSLGFEKAAQLREIYGDAEGSAQFLDEANRRSSQNDVDQRAFLLTEKARLILAAGNTKAAEETLAEATRLFPDSQLAIAGLAQVRMAEGKFAHAASLLEKRYRTVPSAANLYDWAEALDKAGQTEAASVQFKNFEKQASAQHETLLLIRYYTDRKSDPAQALSLATKEVSERHDSATLDAYAWALYRNGNFTEAKMQEEKALAVGTKNTTYFCHAAQIESMAKDKAAADKYASSCPAQNMQQTASEVHP